MVKKIVSHLPPRHLDDFLAVAYLKYLFPQAELEFVHPQRVPLEYLQDSKIILVDVGSVYDPEKNNYDHHQNINLPCSLVLVLKHFSDMDIENNYLLQVIDFIDRFGLSKAIAKFGIKNTADLGRNPF